MIVSPILLGSLDSDNEESPSDSWVGKTVRPVEYHAVLYIRRGANAKDFPDSSNFFDRPGEGEARSSGKTGLPQDS